MSNLPTPESVRISGAQLVLQFLLLRWCCFSQLVWNQQLHMFGFLDADLIKQLANLRSTIFKRNKRFIVSPRCQEICCCWSMLVLPKKWCACCDCLLYIRETWSSLNPWIWKEANKFAGRVCCFQCDPAKRCYRCLTGDLMCTMNMPCVQGIYIYTFTCISQIYHIHISLYIFTK